MQLIVLFPVLPFVVLLVLMIVRLYLEAKKVKILKGLVDKL